VSISSRQRIVGRCRFADSWTAVAAVVALLACASGCELAAVGQNVEGTRLFSQGNYQGAADRFQQAMQSDPTNPDSFYNLAATLHRRGYVTKNPTELEQAESLYNQCLDRDPNHTDCYRGLAVLLTERGESEKAFSLLQGWADRSPSLADPKIELARLHDEFGDRGRSIELLTEALELSPENPRALVALGRHREQAGDPEQALACYNRSLKRNPNQPQVQHRVAALHRVAAPAAIVTPPDGTRIVTTPGVMLR